MFARHAGLAIAVCVLVLTQRSWSDEPRDKPPSSPHWEKLLGWLPENSETLMVLQTPYTVPKWVSPQDRHSQLEEMPFSDMIRAVAASLTLAIGDGLLQRELQGQKIICTVEGSRGFRAPENLGLMPYDGCHIMLFEDAADETLKKAFKNCLIKAEKKIELVGQQVAVFTEKMETDDWSYFITRPRPNVLICATDRAFLEETLKRIDKVQATRAFPADLLEWKHVNTKASVWAIRHYRKEAAANDPSSPLRDKAPANVPDPDAVGFVFWYEGKMTAQARYLSNAKDAVAIATKGWRLPSVNTKPAIKQAIPGVVEISADVSESLVGQMFLLVLLGHLGHGAYL